MKFNRTTIEYQALCDFLRGEMRRQKIKQEVVATWLNIPPSAVSKRLSGQNEWTMREVISVFELLGVSWEWKSENGSNSEK